MAWFGLAKMALQAGAKVYANKQRTKMAMSDAQLMHAERQARGEESYQGKLLEARQNDYKDEFVLVIISAPIIVLAWGVLVTILQMMAKRWNFSFIILAHCQYGSKHSGLLS